MSHFILLFFYVLTVFFLFNQGVTISYISIYFPPYDYALLCRSSALGLVG